MKKILSFIAVCGFICLSIAQEAADRKVMAGITIGGAMNFNKSQSNLFETNMGGDLIAGMTLDWNFSKNIGLNLGLEFDFNRFKTSFKDSIFFDYDDKDILRKRDLEEFSDSNYESFLVSDRGHKSIYLTIPVMLKFQTNYLGYFRYYGKFGVRNNFLLSARVNNTGQGLNSDLDKTTDIKEINEMKTPGLLSFYKAEIGLAGGAEYNIIGTTVLMAEIGYYYGASEVFRTAAIGKEKDKNMSLFRFNKNEREYYTPSLRQGVLMLKIAVLF